MVRLSLLAISPLPAWGGEIILPSRDFDRDTRVQALYRTHPAGTRKGSLIVTWTDAYGRLVDPSEDSGGASRHLGVLFHVEPPPCGCDVEPLDWPVLVRGRSLFMSSVWMSSILRAISSHLLAEYPGAQVACNGNAAVGDERQGRRVADSSEGPPERSEPTVQYRGFCATHGLLSRAGVCIGADIHVPINAPRRSEIALRPVAVARRSGRSGRARATLGSGRRYSASPPPAHVALPLAASA